MERKFATVLLYCSIRMLSLSSLLLLADFDVLIHTF
jgi:hypothetical protein